MRVVLTDVRPTGTMRPQTEDLPSVLPTDRLGPTGRPIGELRDELYRIPDAANVAHVIGVWVQSVGVLALAAWWGNPIGWIAAFFLMGRSFARFAILGHESAHRLLFSNRAVNDWVGAWLLAYPAFVPLGAYRRSHMAHHKEEFGPNEPDLMLYAGYPVAAASWWRKMRRDAFGNSGWKNLKGLLRAIRSATARPAVLPILGWQVVLFFGLWLGLGPLVDLSRVLAPAVDDRVARAQSTPGRRRARGHGTLIGPSPHHAPRPPVGVGPVLDGPVQHRLAPGPPRRHRGPVLQAAPTPGRTGTRRIRHTGTGVAELPSAVAPRPFGKPGPRWRRTGANSPIAVPDPSIVTGRS